ncbi:MAG: hypothetical protein ACREJQ_02565, partial [bacterium]
FEVPQMSVSMENANLIGVHRWFQTLLGALGGEILTTPVNKTKVDHSNAQTPTPSKQKLYHVTHTAHADL